MRSIFRAIMRAFEPRETDYDRECRERRERPRKRCLNEAAHKLYR